MRENAFLLKVNSLMSQKAVMLRRAELLFVLLVLMYLCISFLDLASKRDLVK